ncbi:MAG: glycosyltransferase [Chloroflexi bacterium]|nr:glycosyltransferase [Chloroflexota bacterium]
MTPSPRPPRPPAKLEARLSARETFVRWQTLLGLGIFALWALWGFTGDINALVVPVALTTIFTLVVSGYKLYLVYRSYALRARELSFNGAELAVMDENSLPFYTILVPLYKETEVLPRLVANLLALDYPQHKLEVLILLEPDDVETLAALNRMDLPDHIRPLVTPPSQVKTKPRACNIGLAPARGQLVVICVQSRLNYFNPRQNLLTRLFTLEYSFWFDLFLPGLSVTGAPIPLGGTSNHFKAQPLRKIGGWDSFNVAEDCDLGIRLAAAGFKTVTMNSTTWEEANSKVGNWIRQRSRWVKGYAQTYLVHMRHPRRLLRALGLRRFLSFQLIVGGTPLTLLLAPVYWAMTALWVIKQPSFIAALFPPQFYYFGLISLVFGNFTFFYLSLCGAVARGNYDLTKYALLTPFYWALQSWAAWKGCMQLITRPHYWEKTVHGLDSAEQVDLSTLVQASRRKTASVFDAPFELPAARPTSLPSVSPFAEVPESLTFDMNALKWREVQPVRVAAES